MKWLITEAAPSYQFADIYDVSVVPGYFDQQYRQNLFSTWASHLEQASIQFRPDIARVEVSGSLEC